MELDSLKQAWKDQRVKGLPEQEDLQAMLQKKSQSPIARMKRNLFWELVTVVVLYAITILYYLTSNKGQYWDIALMMFVIAALFVVYYIFKNRLLTRMSCVSCEVRSNLQRQVGTLEKYVRFYFIVGTALTPLGYFTAGYFVVKHSPGLLTGSNLLTIFIIIGIALTVVVYFANIWYTNKLYGRHIKNLKALLKQMDESGENNVLNPAD